MKRTKLSQRQLPNYTKAEELGNAVTHIAGAAIGIVLAVICLYRGWRTSLLAGIICAIYMFSMLCVYCISGIYHGMRPGFGKKVMQVLDHCMIYLLIAGTYTPILVLGFLPAYPVIGTTLLILQWGLAVIGIILTAIDMDRYNTFSMICYIGLGWAILPFLKQVYQILTPDGFYLLLTGGISYTLGSVFYCLDTKVSWMHFVFHIFVILGSIFQFLSIYLYLL